MRRPPVEMAEEDPATREAHRKASANPALRLDAHASDGLPDPQRLFAFLAIGLAIAMAVLDTSIVNVALPSIGRDLGAAPSDSVWVINAYQLTITMCLLPLAWLGDSWGSKVVYRWGLVVFTAASVACACSPSLLVLSCARVVQGLGAAGIMSVNIALIRFIFPQAKLGVGVGYASLVVAGASVAGPSIASLILAVAHWPWLFAVNAPLGILALAVAERTLPLGPASRKRLDWRSAGLNAATFGLLMFGLTALGTQGGRRGGGAVTMVIAGLLVGVWFVKRETRLATPILPLDLLRRPLFALSLVTSICAFAAQTVASVALPFFLDRGHHRSQAQIGLLMTPWPLLTALVAPLAGRLSDRVSPQRLAALGLVILAGTLTSFVWAGDEASMLTLSLRLAICGVGFGLFQSPHNRVIMGSAPRERSGGASGLQSMGRLLGQSLGAVAVAAAFSIFDDHRTLWLMVLASGVGFLGAGASALRR